MKTKYLIIGGGISGLSFANYCKEDYLIIEKEKEVGGYCRTIKQDGYVWDYAGHFFHFKTKEMKKTFMNLMKEEKIIQQDKNTKIYYKNSLVDYPFQSNIHQLPKNDFIDCLYDLYNKTEKKEYSNFLDMLYGKFGKSIVEMFLKPYNEKLYACDLNKLDTDAMGRFFPYANIEEIIKNMKTNTNSSYNNMFLYPENGAGSFINKLYNNLNSEKIKLGTTVKSIDIKNKTIVTDKNEIIHYEYLINTIPLNNFIEILDKTHELLQSFSYNQVLVFNLGFEKKSNFHEHWIYVPDKTINFYRIGFYDNILNTDKLSMYVEIGFSKDSKINIRKELEKTLKNLQKLEITTNNVLKSYSAIIMNPAYVHITEKSSEQIERFIQDMDRNNIYSIGRYGAWTYCSMEDCMIQAQNLVEKIK